MNTDFNQRSKDGKEDINVRDNKICNRGGKGWNLGWLPRLPGVYIECQVVL